MEIKRFIFDGSGEEVVKVTNGESADDIPAYIPREVLDIWSRHFYRRWVHESRLNSASVLKHIRETGARTHAGGTWRRGAITLHSVTGPMPRAGSVTSVCAFTGASASFLVTSRPTLPRRALS
jgi:hypothetical protein